MPILFDTTAFKAQQEFAHHNLKAHDFLLVEARFQLVEKLIALKASFESAFQYGLMQISATEINAQKIQYGHILKTANNHYVFSEELVDLQNNNFDLIVSFFTLNNIDDILGSIIQYKARLIKKGFFAGVIFGGNTLHELRTAMKAADLKLNGGLSPRIMPMIDVSNAARLIQKSGLEMPLSSSETITVEYKNLQMLLKDIKGMGQGNTLALRDQKYVGRKFFEAVEKQYMLRSSCNGKLIATFDIITFIGKKLR